MQPPVGAAPAHPARSSDDEAFVARLRAGDDAAFEELLRTHGGRMLMAARRILGNDADAADALQDAMFSVSKSIGTFTERSQLATWLHRIAVNAALMRLRSRRSRSEESIESLMPAFKEDGHHVLQPSRWNIGEEPDLAREESRRLVRRAIDQLPESFRVVLLLRDIEEVDSTEVARSLGITPNAVKVRLHRARQALRTLLDRQFGGPQS